MYTNARRLNIMYFDTVKFCRGCILLHYTHINSWTDLWSPNIVEAIELILNRSGRLDMVIVKSSSIGVAEPLMFRWRRWNTSGCSFSGNACPVCTFMISFIIMFIIWPVTILLAVVYICSSSQSGHVKDSTSHTRLCSRTQSVDMTKSIGFMVDHGWPTAHCDWYVFKPDVIVSN